MERVVPVVAGKRSMTIRDGGNITHIGTLVLQKKCGDLVDAGAPLIRDMLSGP